MIANRVFLFVLLTAWSVEVSAAEDGDITWLVEYAGQTLPDPAAWTRRGEPKLDMINGALHITDDSTAGDGCFRAGFKSEPGQEIVVEARVKVGSVMTVRGGQSIWPWRDGAPISLLVCDGRHQEGLVLIPSRLATFTDRFFLMDTAREFHTYRLVIRGEDMSVSVDGKQVIEGRGAFWQQAKGSDPFIQFGSNSKSAIGDAHWQSVKLGVRKPTTTRSPSPLRITISEPWEIPVRRGVPQTRPYLYNMGQGLLLMSVAQGPDAFYEPYGLLKSTDEGKTWVPIPGLDQLPTTPLPVLRRKDGGILAMSRWTYLQTDGSVLGKTFHLNADATSFTMEDNRIVLPASYANETDKDQTICERNVWNDADGGVTMTLWSRKAVRLPDGRSTIERWTHLMRSHDEGRTWRHLSVVGPGGEPAVARISDTKLIAVIRQGTLMPMRQMESLDGGKTWSKPESLEMGSVNPDLVMMSNGVLACSYGRPSSCIMFSIDQGKSWTDFRVVSDRTGYNYTSIQEIRPGRLLYMHDAPTLQGVYVDVERISDPQESHPGN